MTHGKQDSRTNYWEIHFVNALKVRWDWDELEPRVGDPHQFILGMAYHWPRVSYPDPPPVLIPTAAPKDGPYDSVFMSRYWLASPRLRQFFETEAPGQLEFLPITVTGPHAALGKGYTFVHCPEPWAVLHENSWDFDERGKRYIVSPVLNRAKFTDEMLIGLVKYHVTWLIRNDLKLKLIKAGLTGFKFFIRAPMCGEGMGVFDHDYLKPPGTSAAPKGGGPLRERPKSPKKS